MDEPGVIHIVGAPVQVGPRIRQRCSWCGAMLDDVDLTAVARPIADADTPWPTWECGALMLLIPGNPEVRSIVEHVDGEPLPANCCAVLDPLVTA